jgi:hypothetical protein
MSHYGISKVMWEIYKDRDLAERFGTDPAAVLDGRDLQDDEREALASQDLRALFELGMHPFVVYHFALRMAGGASMEFMQDYLARVKGQTVGNLET